MCLFLLDRMWKLELEVLFSETEDGFLVIFKAMNTEVVTLTVIKGSSNILSHIRVSWKMCWFYFQNSICTFYLSQRLEMLGTVRCLFNWYLCKDNYESPSDSVIRVILEFPRFKKTKSNSVLMLEPQCCCKENLQLILK